MRAPISLDLHIPNFNYPGVGPDEVFEKVVEIATTAERSGFSSVSFMDHLHQIGGVGPEENYMLEGWFENEHKAYGFEFPELKYRFEMLEEHLQIARAMFTEDQPSFQGKYFLTHGTSH